ncbi:MAG: DUF5683 domain-containing protein [Gracilimonas sp.]|jgi:hypothetical protein|nr:DUF5683 domain-containing protein [Gracilimonas sp.]
MKKLIIFFLFIQLCGSNTILAQQIDSFSNDIFKKSEIAKKKPLAVQVSNFKYQASTPSAIWDLPKQKPGVAFLASAIVPGAGQAFNDKWARAGVYFAIEAVGWIYHFNRNAIARDQERAYEEFTHQNWSVVAYAQWLVQYSDANNLSQENLDQLRSMVFSNGRPIAPTWGNTPADWAKVQIGILHDVENQTPFILNSPEGCWNNSPPNCDRRAEFSHELPKYGSQQYYELISKYYQFQSGWRDWYDAITIADPQTADLYQYMWNGQDQPFAMFYQGRDMAEQFNENYRRAGNILKLLLVNHVVSAFDALFTVQLKNSRIETDTNMLSTQQFSLTWHF